MRIVIIADSKAARSKMWVNGHSLAGIAGTNPAGDIDVCKFYIHGSVHRESNLITVHQDATYSVYYISVGSSTCFGC